MDFITDLLPVDGFDYILVMVDQGLTKGVILTPCKKTITAKETGRLLLENLHCETRRVVKSNLKGCKVIELMKSVVFQEHGIYHF